MTNFDRIVLVARKKRKLVSGRENVISTLILAHKVLSLSINYAYL